MTDRVISRSGVVISITNCYIRFTLLYFTLMVIIIVLFYFILFYLFILTNWAVRTYIQMIKTQCAQFAWFTKGMQPTYTWPLKTQINLHNTQKNTHDGEEIP